MKTKILISLTGIVALLASIVITNAQTVPVPPPISQTNTGEENNQTVSAVPDSLPIGSVAERQADAWERVSQIHVGSAAQSIINGFTNHVSYVSIDYKPFLIPDPNEIFGIVRTQQLVLDVLYPSQDISLGSWLFDKHGNNLFYAQSQAPINPPLNGVSKNILDITFELSDYSFIPFPNVDYYYIVERDNNGNAIRFWNAREYEQGNNGIMYPNYFSGKKGEIVITLIDGTQVAYSNSDHGRKIKTTQVNVDIGNISALGLRTLGGTNRVVIEVTAEEFKRHINPAIRFVFKGGLINSGWADFNCWLYNSVTGQVEYASSVDIWPQGQPSSTGQRAIISLPGQGTSTPLKEGVAYWAKFNFVSGFGQIKNQFNPPYQYEGGKGGGSSEPAPAP